MDFTWLFLQMLLVLVVVCVGAVLVLRYLLPRLSFARKWEKTGQFELIDRFGIDFRKALYLIRVGKRFLVLGGSDQQLRLLAELTPEELEGKK